MAPPRQPSPYTASSGRRGYLIWQYGTKFFVPIVDANWQKGIVRDTARVAIPPGAVYDSADFLLHQPGLAQKRGGTAYAGPAMTNTNSANTAIFADFPSNNQVLALGTGGTAANNLFKIAAGTTTNIGGNTAICAEKPKIWATKSYVIIANSNGFSSYFTPQKYDGTNPVSSLGGSPPSAAFSEFFKSRLVLGRTSSNPNRLFFSPVPDIESTWDTTNSWIDCDHPITGLAALGNTLLVFSLGYMERIIGSTPPPNSDMDRAPVSATGCSDAHSICIRDGLVYFANPRGVYVTNGTTPQCLTDQGGIATFWQSLLSGYDYTTWRIAAGMIRNFLVVSVINNSSSLVATLMCNIPTRSWWRLTNISASGFAEARGINDELYYADTTTNRVGALSGIFTPSASNKNDANGTAVTPMIEFRTMGDGTGIKQFGYGRLSYDMRDAASDNPTMAVTVKTGVEADTSVTPAESPLAETTTVARKRFTVSKAAQAVTVKLQQANASSKTELYALEVDERAQSDVAEGVS